MLVIVVHVHISREPYLSSLSPEQAVLETIAGKKLKVC
jgi:hypothetical protein